MMPSVTMAAVADRARRFRDGFRLGALQVDLLLAAVLTVAAGIGTYTELRYASRPYPAAAGGYALTVLAAVPLVLRRRYPVPVALAVLLVVFGYHLAGYPGEAPGLALFAAIYSVAGYGATVWSVATSALLVLLAQLVPTLPPHRVSWSNWSVLGPAMGMAWMVVLGAAARHRRLAAEQRVHEAENAARGRLAEERLRIARELHDVLAHTISVIAVQSGLALDSLEGADGLDGTDRPDRRLVQAREAMRAVRAAARQAMPELRAALGLLRADRDTPPEALAQPRLAQLPELAERARSAGLRVEIGGLAEVGTLPPFLELTAYRIVQEALTNVVRHAEAGSATVALRLSEGTLLVEVTDDGRGDGGRGTGAGPAGAGLGLVGMRERAELVGGQLTAGPRPAGGFAVRARLPVEVR
jgi:signal transduction histidine kinase